MDSSELMEKWWRISVGRGENVKGQSLILESALPLNISYLQAIRIDLLNKEKIRISEAELIFHPYFSIEYLFKAQVKDPTRRLHKFEDADTLFVDALDGRVLNALPEKGLGLLKAIKRIASETSGSENERTVKLLQELRNNEALTKYTVEIKDDYKGNQLQPAITPRQAIEAAMDFIIERDTQEIAYTPKTEEGEIFSQPHYVTYVPKKSDIRMLHKDIIIVPRWSIEFEAFNKSYGREILAFSGIILEDTMQYCPKHFKVGAITLAPRKTIAVCEACGQSFCDSHVKMCPICRKWLCEEDGIECTVCKNRFCKEHQLLSCSVCNKPLCNSCAVVCPICGTKYCRDHVRTCDNCKRNMCPNCVIITGFIRKTRTCKKCATQL
jgi:hypothetical protein